MKLPTHSKSSENSSQNMYIDLSQSRQQVLQPTTIPQQSLDPFLGHIDLFHLSQWLWLLFFQDNEKNRSSAEISKRGLCSVVHWGMQVRPWALPLQICCSTETLIVVSQGELNAPLQPYSPASPATFFSSLPHLYSSLGESWRPVD